MTTSELVRDPAVAGMFYPGRPDVLSKTIEQLLSGAESKRGDEQLFALVCPHAGYQYSGSVAAAGFSLLRGRRYDAAVVVSPSHREYFDGISVYNGKAYRTPLGEMMIDEELREQLVADDPSILCSPLGHGAEHAVEVQLPFLQTMLGNIRILPIVIGDQQRENCFHLGERLGSLLMGKNVLLIASTDLSHYHPDATARSMDRIIIDAVARFDYERLMDDLESERAEACGGGPTVSVLLAAHRMGAKGCHVLSYRNSGDVTGDRQSVVGYLSAAIWRTA